MVEALRQLGQLEGARHVDHLWERSPSDIFRTESARARTGRERALAARIATTTARATARAAASQEVRVICVAAAKARATSFSTRTPQSGRFGAGPTGETVPSTRRAADPSPRE